MQLEKKPIYEEPSITKEEDNYKILFGDDQDSERNSRERKETERRF
jgi:hypothetical protein